MGVWGWTEIQDGVTLKGVVKGKAFYNWEDGDWNFNVDPAPAFKYLATNPAGLTNKHGYVQCEIEPPDHIYPEPVEATAEAIFSNYMGDIAGTWVTVVGTWVRDDSHSVTSDSINFGQPLGGPSGKTEIHPITSILVEHPPLPDNRSRVIDFLVFSSAGSNTKALEGLPSPHPGVPGAPSAPHTDKNRRGEFDVLVPNTAFDDPSGTNILSQVDKSASQGEFTVFDGEPTPFYHLLQGRVWSGKGSDGRGFYYVRVEVRPGYTLRTYAFSRGIDLKLGIRGWMSQYNVSSIRALFDHA